MLCGHINIILFFPVLFVIHVQAQITFPLGSVTHWSRGSTVKLPWTYKFDTSKTVAVQISFVRFGTSSSDGVGLAEAIKSRNLTSRNPSTYSIEGQATLVFRNADLIHNGTYSLIVTLRGGTQARSNVEVIILDEPKAEATCSKDPTAFSCTCKGLLGNPPPWVTWLKDGKVINGGGYLEKELSLDNIRDNGEGVYTCNATSYNLTATDTETMAAPGVTSFKIYKEGNIANLLDRVTITCEARGNPPPVYIISLNGSKVADEKVFVMPEVSRENAGNYTCLAKNLFGNATFESFHFKVTGETASENVHQSYAETEWYVIVVTLICGAIFGAIVMYLVTFCLRRRSKARHHPRSSNPRNVSEAMNRQAENVSTYQELGLRNMNEGDNYQSLTKNSKIDPSKETYYENEQALYQELNKVRGNVDDNYQALQRP